MTRRRWMTAALILGAGGGLWIAFTIAANIGFDYRIPFHP